MSRTVSGLAAVSLGLGASLIAAPAWADSPQGASGTYSYTCDDQVGDLSETMDIEIYVAAPAEGEVGQEIEFQMRPNDYKYFSYTDGGEVTSGTLSVDVDLAGEAAPSPTASASIDADGGFGSNNEETFDESSLSGTFTPAMPGEVALSPGDITVDVDQSAGPSTTVCSPDSSTEELATVDVTGEPAETETPEDDGGGDDSGSGSEEPAAAGDDAPPQALLVGGAVAGGLLVIVGLGMFGLMFYFMRRS